MQFFRGQSRMRFARFDRQGIMPVLRTEWDFACSTASQSQHGTPKNDLEPSEFSLRIGMCITGTERKMSFTKMDRCSSSAPINRPGIQVPARHPNEARATEKALQSIARFRPVRGEPRFSVHSKVYCCLLSRNFSPTWF